MRHTADLVIVIHCSTKSRQCRFLLDIGTTLKEMIYQSTNVKTFRWSMMYLFDPWYSMSQLEWRRTTTMTVVIVVRKNTYDLGA